MKWSTDAWTPGKLPSLLADQRLGRATGLRGKNFYEEEAWVENPRPRCDHKRYCQECGKEVCSYKDVHAEKVWCYAHDHLTPWTWLSIVGFSGRKRLPLGVVGRGRKPST